MLSDEKIAEYDEAQDPDYKPNEETPDEPLEYDSQAEISQEHIADEEVAEGTTAEEVEEETVEPEATEESQEIVTEESSQEELVTEESSQEGTVEDDACNTPVRKWSWKESTRSRRKSSPSWVHWKMKLLGRWYIET